MMTDLTWTEFCELYYDTAKKSAEIHLSKLVLKYGEAGAHVDRQYVVDAAALTAMEKTYTNFEASRGTKITTYLSRIAHNEVVDEYTKESKAAEKQANIDYLRSSVKSYSEDMSPEAKETLITRMRSAILKLSPSDQVILGLWLEDKKTYVARSSEALGTSEQYVTLRRYRIFELIPKLMGMTQEDYWQYKELHPADLLANVVSSKNSRITDLPTHHPNPIMPLLDINSIADKLCGIL